MDKIFKSTSFIRLCLDPLALKISWFYPILLRYRISNVIAKNTGIFQSTALALPRMNQRGGSRRSSHGEFFKVVPLASTMPFSIKDSQSGNYPLWSLICLPSISMQIWHRLTTERQAFWTISWGMMSNSSLMISFSWGISLGERAKTRSLRYPQRKKSGGVISGDLAGHLLVPRRPIHSGKISSRKLRTARA